MEFVLGVDSTEYYEGLNARSEEERNLGSRISITSAVEWCCWTVRWGKSKDQLSLKSTTSKRSVLVHLILMLNIIPRPKRDF